MNTTGREFAMLAAPDADVSAGVVTVAGVVLLAFGASSGSSAESAIGCGRF